eukprot:m.15370 g.15370  ORF g.15370 m.15370 type:complete len:243 (+) comp6659_c0_seq1:98-826(+)
MNHAQEQEEELAALSAIFDDVTISEEEPKKISLPVRASEELGCTLNVTYVAKYPEEVPLLSLSSQTGFSEAELAALLEKINTTATESLGMAMIFSLHATAKEYVDELQTKREQEAEEQKRREEEEANRAEVERHIVGTLVTSETFEAWRVNFMKDVDAKLEAAQAAERASRKGRLTGRQLFERDASLRTSDIKEVAPDEVAVDASLFEDLDIEDIDEEDGAGAGAAGPPRSIFSGETFSDDD